MAEQTFNDRVIEQYRATGGEVTMLYEDSTLVLVTMRGARSGREITLPLEFLEWDGVLHLFATKSGAPTNPSWYYNLLANPDVTVEHGRETFSRARPPARGGRARPHVAPAGRAETAVRGVRAEDRPGVPGVRARSGLEQGFEALT